VKPDKLIGANKAFLERELPHIASLMRSSLDEVLQEAEVIVVTNRSQAFRNLRQLVRPQQILIDFAGISRKNGKTQGSYEGICW
jgi:GDP-mannose 6-dehydrogenase